MPDRVEVDPEVPVRRWLVRMYAGTCGHDGRLGCGDVGNRQVEVKLLRVRTARPTRLDPVVDKGGVIGIAFELAI